MRTDSKGKEFYLTTKEDEVRSVAHREFLNAWGRWQALAALVVLVTIAIAIAEAIW